LLAAVARPEERKFLGFSVANDGSERRIAPNALAKIKARIREITRRTRGRSLPQVVEELKPYLTGWRSYSDSVRPHGCSQIWKRGSAEDCVCIFGGSGRTGTIASRSCAVEAFQNSLPRSRPVRRRASGACQDTRHFRRHCAITFSTLSACLAFTSRVEAQPGRTAEVRDPYARWCGRGGAVRRPPIPINGTLCTCRAWKVACLLWKGTGDQN
jgi:Group II intron, maturase-specific domain